MFFNVLFKIIKLIQFMFHPGDLKHLRFKKKHGKTKALRPTTDLKGEKAAFWSRKGTAVLVTLVTFEVRLKMLKFPLFHNTYPDLVDDF